MCPGGVTEVHGRIRRAELRDLPALSEIYNDAIRRTTATFDLYEKDADDRLAWFRAHQGRYLLVIYEAQDGQICGYASLSCYRDRPAFDTTVENSVYLRDDCRGRGIGTELLRTLLDFASKQPDIETIVALITSENAASIRLHERAGFVYCGQLRNAGVKFGRRLHLNIYEYTFV